MSAVTSPSPRRAAAHEALLYDDPAAATCAITAFAQEGLAAGEAVIVSLPTPRLADVSAALGADAAAVTLVDFADVGGSPARMFAEFLAWMDEHPGEAVRVVGEPMWAGRSAAELEECVVNEVLWDHLPEPRLRTLCPVDVVELPTALVEEARRAHPVVRERGGRRPGGVPLSAPAEVLSRPLPPPTGPVSALDFAVAVAEVRRHVEVAALTAGLDGVAVHDLVLAASEIAGNSVRHAGGSGQVRTWRDAAEGTLVVEVSDAGRLTDPYAGRRPLVLEGTNGRGLGIAVRLCDLVQIRSGDTGTTVRLHQRRR